jgi:hypothetical protein
MDAVENNHAPQNVANRHRSAKELNRPIEILRLEFANPCDGFLVDTLEPGASASTARGRSMCGGLALMLNPPVSMPKLI